MPTIWTESRPGTRILHLVDVLLHADDPGIMIFRCIEEFPYGYFWCYLSTSLNIDPEYGDQLTTQEVAQYIG